MRNKFLREKALAFFSADPYEFIFQILPTDVRDCSPNGVRELMQNERRFNFMIRKEVTFHSFEYDTLDCFVYAIPDKGNIDDVVDVPLLMVVVGKGDDTELKELYTLENEADCYLLCQPTPTGHRLLRPSWDYIPTPKEFADKVVEKFFSK